MTYSKQIKTAIDLILISVKTAPKSGGQDDIVCLSVSPKQKNSIAKKMIEIGKDKSKGVLDKKVKQAIQTSWYSDAQAIRGSQGLILVGVRGKKPFGSNCSGCGFKNCLEFHKYNMKNKYLSFLGPFCLFKIWDLGIAIASAAETASRLKIDNRIMYRVGFAAQLLKLRWDNNKTKSNIINRVSPILGLPLCVSGKNIYFDRLDKLRSAEILKRYFSLKQKRKF